MQKINFKNWGEANEFCRKYDVARLVGAADKFELAEALLAAYNDGKSAGKKEFKGLASSIAQVRHSLKN